MKDQFLRVRLDADSYARIRADADAAGMTIAEHVRCVVDRDRDLRRREMLVLAVEDRLIASPLASDGRAIDIEPIVTETLMLLRELVAERNAQILSRVSQQLNCMYPNRRK
jgi:hypothetical protein